jgi:hypothetical protein
LRRGCEDARSKEAPKRIDVTERQSPDVPRCVTCTVGVIGSAPRGGGKGLGRNADNPPAMIFRLRINLRNQKVG